jgi:hypothetical protein
LKIQAGRKVAQKIRHFSLRFSLNLWFIYTFGLSHHVAIAYFNVLTLLSGRNNA